MDGNMKAEQKINLACKLKEATKIQGVKTMRKTAMLTMALAAFIAASAMGIELDVPFKAQVLPGTWGPYPTADSRNCGPASVLMATAYHLGFVPTEQQIKDLNDWMFSVGIITDVRNYNGDYTDATDLIRIAKEYFGFNEATKYNNNDLDLLRQALSDNNPIIVGVKLNMSTTLAGHFMLLVGITDTEVIVNDPGHTAGSKVPYPIAQFQASWETQNYCSVIINSQAGWDNFHKFGERHFPAGAIIAADTNADGSLNGEDFWLIENSRRRKIMTAAVMKSWNRTFGEAVQVRPEELENYPLGADLLYRPGTIVEYENTYHYIRPTVSGGLARNDATLFALQSAGFHQEKFVSAQAGDDDSAALSAIPSAGSLIAPVPTAMPGVLVKGSGPEIYCLKLHADGKIYRQHVYSEKVFQNQFGSYYPNISEVDYVSVSDFLLYACPGWPEPLGFGDGAIIRLADELAASGLTFPAGTGFMVSDGVLRRMEPDLDTRLAFMGYNPAAVLDVPAAQVWPRIVADSLADGNSTFEIAGGSGGGQALPSSIQISLAQTIWQVLTSSENTGSYVSARVFDQDGNEMAGQRVLFVSDSVFPDYVFTVSADNGSCLAWSLGQAEVWAELYDNREIRSERISVSVVESLPETPPPPVVLPEATGLRITDGLRPTSYPLRYLAGSAPSVEGGLKNVSNEPITFAGPAMLLFRVSDGAWLDFGGYPVEPKTWAPGQGAGPNYYLGGCYIWDPGDYYLALGVKINGQWHLVSQTEANGQNKLYFHIIDPADVKAELQKHSFVCLIGQPRENDDLLIRTWIKNAGDLAISAPFDVIVSLAGGQSQTRPLAGLATDEYVRIDCNFGQQPAGTYKFDLFIDSGSAVPEYNKGDNTDSLLVEVAPALWPDLVIADFAPTSPEFTGSEPVCLAGAVSNQGLGLSEPCQLALFLPDGTVIETAEIPGLAAGEYYDFSVFIDADLPDGTSLISALADSNGVVAESDEGNNGAECSVVIAELALPLVHIPFGCRGKTSKPDDGK